MTAINFPDSPSNGDTHVVGGVTYTYDSTETKWKTTINSNAFLPLTGGTVSGNIVLGGELQHSGDTDTKLHFDTDTIKFDTAGSERARIDSSGRLGIGTPNPATTLDCNGIIRVPQDTFYQSGDGTGGWVELIKADSSNNTYIKNNKNRAIIFETGGAEKARIDSSGRLLVGFTGELGSNQLFSLGVQNNTKAAGFYTTASSGYSAITVGRGNNGAVIETYYGTSQVGSVTVTSTTTAFNTTSDYRLKENVTPVPDGIARLQQLKPSRFNFIADPDNTVDGFLAHEVQTVVPEAITGEKDEVDADGNPVYQVIDQSKLVPLLTAALQEALAKIETLETRLTALEGGAA